MSTMNSTTLETIGYDQSIPRCGNFLVVDHNIVETARNIEGLDVLPLVDAFEKYPHVKEKLYFNLVDPSQNEYSEMASETEPLGYYIRVEKGVHIEEPMQAAFLMGENHNSQIIHNIIELEEGASLQIINGCSAGAHTGAGRHIGVTETYLGEGSELGYTMLHNWGPSVEVFPVGAVRVGKNARYISNYVAMTTVKKIRSNPNAYVEAGGSAQFYSMIYARHGSNFDMGSNAILLGEGANGEIISRVVSEGGRVVSRQMLNGKEAGTLGHMECSGLLINDEGMIHSIPELKGEHPDISLSHEAAVGKISAKELSYLMTRGLNEDQARALIIRGFLDIKIKGLPEKIQELINDIIESSINSSI